MKTKLIFSYLILSFFLRAQNASFNTALIHRLPDTGEREMLDILVTINDKFASQVKSNEEIVIKYSSGNIISMRCTKSALLELASRGLITRAEYIPARKQVMNDTMRVRNRINAIHAGEAPLSQSYSGSGTILGFIDTGIDFNHPDFKDAQGNTRILYIWDQTPNSASAPQPFNYGTEWTAAQINASLCTHSDAPYYGHGTHVAGIAAGNGRATGRHKGVAPDASIIMVALDFNKTGPTISDGVKYIFDKAYNLGQPCVINISVGDYYGSHDGKDLETIIIENEINAMAGRAVVAAAGNSGNYRYHTKTQPLPNDTLFTWFTESGNTLSYSFYADTAQVKNLRLSIGANRSNYGNLGNIGFKNWNYALNVIKTDTLKFNNKRIGIVKTSASVNNYGVYEYQAEITADTLNLFWRIETTGQGLHHAWNFSFVESNLPSAALYPRITKYLMPDSFYTLVSGFQCSDEIITVANYYNSKYYYDVRDSLRDSGGQTFEISEGSSQGPTRDGRQKPDIATSGQIIFSAGVISQLPFMIANQPIQVAQDSMHVIGGGTSAASPIAAGVAALYFQKNQMADNHMLKKAMLDCAYRDSFTGNNLPDYQWGFGKLDGKNTLLCGENLAGIESVLKESSVKAYPIPFDDHILIELPEGNNQKKLDVFNTAGQLIYSTTVYSSKAELNAGMLGGQRGLLLLKISTSSGSYPLKVTRN